MNKYLLIVSFAFLFLLVPLAAASDFAYVLKNSAGIDSYLLQELQNMGYTYDIIYEPNIPSADFSNYRLIIVGNQNFANITEIPVESHKSLIINSYNVYKSGTDYQLGWSTGISSTSSPTSLDVFDSGSLIVSGLSLSFYAYNGSHTGVTTSFLANQKPSLLNKILTFSSDTTKVAIATMEPGSTFLNSKVAAERNLFFGITNARYWTSDTKTLFANSITWLLEGEDRDNDGFTSDTDCNDTNSSIYPGASEISYDYIDQNCDGFDIADVDNDGYCLSGYLIQNKALQCPDEQGILGTDCDDNNELINPGSSDLSLNCINDPPIISDISDIVINEGELAVIAVDATDPEGDALNYSINNSNFEKDNNVFFWQTSYNSSGDYYLTVTVSDGQLNSSSSFSLEIIDVNQPPISINIPQIIFNEDSSSFINLSNYFYDSDGDSLDFGIDSSSENPYITAVQQGDSFNLTSLNNWNGADWVVFYASDREYQTKSNIVSIIVSPVNDAPAFLENISTIQMNEGENLENALNLNDYFSDIDSELTYSVSGNENISIIIDYGEVSLSPNSNWYGEETVVFNATDGEFTVSSNEVILNVTKAREPPVFSNLSCETNLTEDISYSCILEATDFENDSISFSVGNQNNLGCEISGNNLTYRPLQDYNGNASCDLVASDIDGIDVKILVVNVSPVNDLPSFNGNIENQTFSQNTNLNYALDLNDYFSDIDSQLEYSVSGSANVSVEIDDGIVSFIPDFDWYGQETLVFEASDGEYTVFSNPVLVKILYVGKPPVFSNLSCETNLTEDISYSCILEATDVENDTIFFSVGNQDNTICYLEGNELFYSGKLNYNGNASCTILASDIDGTAAKTLNFYINPVNDAPIITSRAPSSQSVSVIEGKSQTFTITASDIEDDPIAYSWFINNVKANITSRALSLSNIDPGIYNITVIVSDSESETSYSWTLTAGSLSQYTCSQVSGHICTEKQTCSSSFLGVYDAHRCCQTTCIPVFKDAQKCSSINSSLKVTIESPGNEEEFSVGDTINVDVKVSNELSKDQNLEISAELYDTTDENSIADNSVDLDLAEGDSDTVTINLEVPEADDSHDYVIFVRAKDNACNQAYIPVKIVLPEHKLEINKIDSFDEAVCGDVLDFKVNVLNLGSNDETAYIKVTNSKLKISEVSDEFDIERLGDDDSISKTLEVTIPDNAGAGNYTFAISAISEDAESSSAKSIILGECSKPVSKKTVSTRIELNSTTSSSEQQAEKTDKSVFIVGIIVFVMIIASISIISYALFKKRKSKNYSSQIY